MSSPLQKRFAAHQRGGSFIIGKARRRTRRGQTLVEYALILAYISVLSMQVLSYLGFIANKQYVYVNCVAIVANTNNQNISTAANRANEMSAVYSYLVLTSTWRNAPSAWAVPAITEIYNKVYGIVYSN